jgi:hypothetical protein
MRELGWIKEVEFACEAACEGKRGVYRYICEARLNGVEEPLPTISKLLFNEFLRGVSVHHYGAGTSTTVTTCAANELRMNGNLASAALWSILRPENYIAGLSN